MSTHQQPAAILPTTNAVAEAIAALPSPIHFLSSRRATRFAPVNTNGGWTASFGKRLLDLSVAIPAFLLLAPLFLVIAALVAIDASGPVFFRQKRTGACGRTFEILKFRTMTVMEDGAEVKQAVAGDPRTTRIGGFLRRYSLDELPQLLNVLNGDMSLVGPRPHAKAHDAYYGVRIADYGHRFAVKPGMTGWAQVRGHRGPTPTLATMESRIDHDVWYVKNASLALDLKILLKTPFAIVSARNAF